MPIYEFGCKACRRKFEKIVPPGRTPAAARCERCGGKSARLPSRFAVAGTRSKSGSDDDWGADLGGGEEGGDPEGDESGYPAGDETGDDAFDD